LKPSKKLHILETRKRLYYEGSYLHENQKQSGKTSRQPLSIYSLIVIMKRKKEIGAWLLSYPWSKFAHGAGVVFIGFI